jgi:hypothetical protein
VLVVGAGASKEVELPTGNELKERIASLLDIRYENGVEQISGDRLIRQALQLTAQNRDSSKPNINPYLHAGWRIRNAMPQSRSIDHFLDTHRGDPEIELCGKLAIVRSILQAERNSLLFVDSLRSKAELNYKSLDGTWFNYFMQLLTEDCRKEQLRQCLSLITLIVFNYDRCIEHFLYHSLQNYYGIDERDAASLICELKIYHPYGTVGPLPWYGKAESVEFGADVYPEQLLNLASQVKTFTEGTNQRSSDISEIRDAMMTSQTVLFLGFSFHQLNLDLIYANDNKEQDSVNARYYATAKGLSESNCELIHAELAAKSRVLSENIKIRRDLTCSQLLPEYWRSLSLDYVFV